MSSNRRAPRQTKQRWAGPTVCIRQSAWSRRPASTRARIPVLAGNSICRLWWLSGRGPLQWHRSVPRGTLPASEPCERLAPHTAPRPVRRGRSRGRESCCSRWVCLQPQGPYLTSATVTDRSSSVTDWSPAPRQPSFEVGIPLARPYPPGYDVPRPFGGRRSLLGASCPAGALCRPGGWPTGLPGTLPTSRPDPKRVSPLRTSAMRPGWVLSIRRSLVSARGAITHPAPWPVSPSWLPIVPVAARDDAS